MKTRSKPRIIVQPVAGRVGTPPRWRRLHLDRRELDAAATVVAACGEARLVALARINRAEARERIACGTDPTVARREARVVGARIAALVRVLDLVTGRSTPVCD